MILEMDVLRSRGKLFSDARQCQVVSCDQPDCIAPNQTAHNPFSPDAAIMRVCPVKDFVKQKEHRKLSFG